MAKSTIYIGITDASPAERREAIAYVENADRDLTITSFEEIPGEVDRLVAEAFIAGVRHQKRTTEDYETLRTRVAEAINDGGFGTVGYDSVDPKDIAEDILSAIGLLPATRGAAH